MGCCGSVRIRSSKEFSYLVVAGVKERDGELPVIKRRYRVVSFVSEKSSEVVIRYVGDQGWFPRTTRWIEVYRVLPITEGEKNHRRFDLDTIFKDLDNDKAGKQIRRHCSI